MNSPTKVIAGVLGLTAFSIAVLAGLSVGNSADTVLVHALVSMVACQILGFAIGTVGERVARDAIARYQKEHPIPDPDVGGESSDARRENAGVSGGGG